MSAPITYQERQVPSVAVWGCVAVLGILTAAATAPLGITVASVAAIGVMALVAATLWATAPRIEVGPDGLRVGQHFLAASAIGPARAFVGAAAKERRGPGADPRERFYLRGWIRDIVAVAVVDDDPAPAWVISTRRPAELCTALQAIALPTAR